MISLSGNCCIFYNDFDRHSVGISDRPGAGFDPGVFERRVTQPKTERKQRLNILLVVVSVADKDALTVDRSPVYCGKLGKGRGILEPLGERFREFARPIDPPRDHIGNSPAASLAAEPSLDDGFSRGLPMGL